LGIQFSPSWKIDASTPPSVASGMQDMVHKGGARFTKNSQEITKLPPRVCIVLCASSAGLVAYQQTVNLFLREFQA
jgi:hypothetical protein